VLRSNRFAALRGFAVLLAVALLFALLAAACDGDGDEGERPEAAETPEVGETPEADGDGADGEGLADLEALAAEAAGGVTAKVTYRYRSEVDGEVTEGEWVLVQRPPDSRFEMSGTEDGQEFRTIIINAGGKTYLCTSVAGEESCLATETEATEAQTALLDPLFNIPQELAEDAEDIDLGETSQRTIAGVDATCFTVIGGIIDLGQGEVCFSEGGILLLLQGESDGDSFSFEATSVSTDVTDADFEPPYPIIELPEFELPES
jgi:hypothetical protein